MDTNVDICRITNLPCCRCNPGPCGNRKEAKDENNR